MRTAMRAAMAMRVVMAMRVTVRSATYYYYVPQRGSRGHCVVVMTDKTTSKLLIRVVFELWLLCRAGVYVGHHKFTGTTILCQYFTAHNVRLSPICQDVTCLGR
jgi:hypothetical protein